MSRVVGVEVTVAGLGTVDAVTDLIEVMVDSLDEAGFVPNVSAAGIDPVRLRVEIVDGPTGPRQHR